MLELIVDNNDGQLKIRVRYKCPHCEKEAWFVINAPLICDKCREDLPNIAALLEDPLERIIWHRRGKTITADRHLRNIAKLAVGREHVHSTESSNRRVCQKHVSLVQIYH